MCTCTTLHVHGWQLNTSCHTNTTPHHDTPRHTTPQHAAHPPTTHPPIHGAQPSNAVCHPSALYLLRQRCVCERRKHAVRKIASITQRPCKAVPREYVNACARVHKRARMCMCACMHVWIMRVCVHTYMRIYASCMCVCMHACNHVYVRACVRACMCVPTPLSARRAELVAIVGHFLRFTLDLLDTLHNHCNGWGTRQSQSNGVWRASLRKPFDWLIAPRHEPRT